MPLEKKCNIRKNMNGIPAILQCGDPLCTKHGFQMVPPLSRFAAWFID